MIQLDWQGEKNRPLKTTPWCPCATCMSFKEKTAPDSYGFVSWSDEEGIGVSIILDREEYDMIEIMLKDPFVTADDCLEVLEKKT